MDEAASDIRLDAIFLDNQTVTVDSKLRLAVPERFMKVLRNVAPEHADKIGAIPAPDHSLKLLPYPAFMERVEYWRNLNDQKSSHRTIRNFIVKLAKVHPLDAQNRIKLTPLQMKFANISREAIIVGDIDCMQLYDPSVYEETLARDLEGFVSAADEVAREKGDRPLP